MKVFIYCTKAKPIIYDGYKKILGHNDYTENSWPLNGIIVASFELNKVEVFNNNFNGDEWTYDEKILEQSCLEDYELDSYLSGKNQDRNFKFGYAWHIENLEIIEPLELDEFYTFRKGYENQLHMNKKTITKAPQSYRYAYYKGEKVIILSVKSEWVEKEIVYFKKYV